MFSSCASAPTHDGGMFSNCASPPHDGARDDDDGDFAAPSPRPPPPPPSAPPPPPPASPVASLLRLSCAPEPAAPEDRRPPPHAAPPAPAPPSDDDGDARAPPPPSDDGSPLSARLLRLSCAPEMDGETAMRPRRSGRHARAVELNDHGRLEREVLRRAREHAQKHDDPPPYERSLSFDLVIEAG